MLGGTADIRDWRHQDRLIVSTPAFYFYSALCPRSESFAFRMPRPKGDNGCLLFTLSFRKIRLESKWNTTFWVVPAENFREQRNIWKGSPVFPDGIIQTEISVQIFFNDFFDTSFRLPRTQTSLFPWKCAPSGKETTSVPFPWSLTVHHQSLAFRARLYDAKNEAPEEKAEFQVFAVYFRLIEVIC